MPEVRKSDLARRRLESMMSETTPGGVAPTTLILWR